MDRILKYNDFLEEGYLTKITREYFGEDERLEERIELPDGVEIVSFTDRNGVFHKEGYRLTDGSDHKKTQGTHRRNLWEKGLGL